MSKCEFKSITINDVPAMVNLLIYRQNLESDAFPYLKNSCLNKKYITDLFNKSFEDKKIIGIGAFDNDGLIGYIIGEIKIDTDYLRGRHIWVPYEGIAIRKDQSSELIRNLYAKASVIWLEQGCFSHYALVPLGSQAYYEAFLRLSFCIEQVHGIMSMEDYEPFANVADIDIRLANKMDSEVMGKMSSIISSYQNSEPMFQPISPELAVKIKEGYEKSVFDNETTIFIAEKDKKEFGFQEYEAATPNLMIPDDGVELNIAGVYSSQMNSGIGKKLMNESYKVMKDRGYNSIITDWRITNLASSTFWPKCGFKPIAYRMVRRIDKNILWANFKMK